MQGTPGAIAVLHTHTRRLDYHPHVHLVMPAAAVNSEKKQWRTKRRSKGKGKGKGAYLFNHKALAKVFRAKLLASIEAAGLTLPDHYPMTWVADCKSVGTGEKALIYLGRYLYRGVIAEKDILVCADGEVSFRYRNAKTGRMERRTVSGAQFLWLVLQHVLLRFAPGQTAAWVKQRAPILCTCCGAVMMIVRTRIRSGYSEGMPPPIAPEGAH